MSKDTDKLKKVKKEELLEEKKEVNKDKKTEKVSKISKKITKKEKEIENKSVQNTVIENIKNFIAKIMEMQEKVKNDEEETKKTEKVEKEKLKEYEAEEEKKSEPKYLLEYYDLPYRYNETVVKILAQTPKRLFVYWDVSDKDKNTYLNAFGEHFFEDTYPVLLIHNENKNYTREVPINDFANSWYLDIKDPRDRYTIQLGRKFKAHIKPQINPEIEETNIDLNNDYLFIAMSNELEVPNDHVLFEEFKPYVKYRNVKTSVEEIKEVKAIIYKNEIKELYSKLYEGQIDIVEDVFELRNPSSMGTSGNFRINQ